MEKVKKKSNNYIQITCTSSYHAKFHNNRYKTVKGVALTRGTNCLYIKGEKRLSSQCGKSDKNDLAIISKSHENPHTIKKTYAKFQSFKTISRPRWLSWMRHPTGDQEVAGSTPAEVGNILSWRLIMKCFLRSFSPFR